MGGKRTERGNRRGWCLAGALILATLAWPGQAQEWIYTVRPGDTSSRISRRMSVEGDRLKHFLVLNGLSRSDPILPGQVVKIVTE